MQWRRLMWLEAVAIIHNLKCPQKQWSKQISPKGKQNIISIGRRSRQVNPDQIGTHCRPHPNWNQPANPTHLFPFLTSLSPFPICSLSPFPICYQICRITFHLFYPSPFPHSHYFLPITSLHFYLFNANVYFKNYFKLLNKVFLRKCTLI